MRTLFLIVFAVLSLHSLAQQSYTTKDKKAIAFYEGGKKLVAARRFPEAIAQFRAATERDKNFAEAFIGLAGCYRILRDNANMKFNLLTAFSIKPDIPDAVYEYYSLASVFYEEGDYKNAEFFLNKFYSFNPTDKRVLAAADKLRDNFEFARKAVQSPLPVKTEVLPAPLNTFQNQYFPSLTADGKFMIYTVREFTGGLDQEDLYISEKKTEGWQRPEQLSVRINTKENEGTASVSGDGKTLVYTYCTPRNGCDLYITRKVGREWTQPEGIQGKINTSGWESNPSLSADGRTLYFSSDRIGGFGKKDIWITRIDSTGSWTVPVNAGRSINTPESDFAPFIHANNITLYFASTGYPGMGGSDFYMTEKTDTGWTEPKNLGYPLNTFANEVSFTVSADFKEGYFSKSVKSNQGRDIYALCSVTLPSELKSAAVPVYLKGKVLDAETKQPVEASVELIHLLTEKTEQNVTSDPQNGDYLLVVPDKKNFGLFVSAKGYLYQSININGDEENITNADDFNIYLQPVKVNSVTALRNLFFETGKYDLDKKSVTELNKLARLIAENNLVLEISGHTDNVGSTQDNQLLSEKRAKSVFDYLTLNKGISKKQLSFKGYGMTKPAAGNNTDEGKRQNRRIEIKILKQ